jgi:DNA-binding MarR family transcriptional regulator
MGSPPPISFYARKRRRRNGGRVALRDAAVGVSCSTEMLLKQQIPSNEHLGFLIAAARRRINQAVGSHARRYRLTPRQFWILVTIQEHPGVSLNELARHLRMDRPTASRVLVALRRRKLVEVRDHDRDRRRVQIDLGAAGRPLAAEITALARSVRHAVAGGFSEPERVTLRALLQRVIHNMDRFHDGRRTRAMKEAR